MKAPVSEVDIAYLHLYWRYSLNTPVAWRITKLPAPACISDSDLVGLASILLSSEDLKTYVIPVLGSKEKLKSPLKLAGGWRFFKNLRVLQKKKII